MALFGRGFVAALALTALLAFAGCADTGGGYVATGPVAGRGDVNLERDVQFADIPGPQEYRLVPQDSYTFQGSTFRTGMLVYEGPVEWSAALDFYRAQMPRFGWTPEQVERGFSVRVLPFTKGQERAIVTVRQIRNGSRAEIQLDNIANNDLLLKGRLPSY